MAASRARKTRRKPTSPLLPTAAVENFDLRGRLSSILRDLETPAHAHVRHDDPAIKEVRGLLEYALFRLDKSGNILGTGDSAKKMVRNRIEAMEDQNGKDAGDGAWDGVHKATEDMSEEEEELPHAGDGSDEEALEDFDEEEEAYIDSNIQDENSLKVEQSQEPAPDEVDEEEEEYLDSGAIKSVVDSKDPKETPHRSDKVLNGYLPTPTSLPRVSEPLKSLKKGVDKAQQVATDTAKAGAKQAKQTFGIMGYDAVETAIGLRELIEALRESPPTPPHEPNLVEPDSSVQPIAQEGLSDELNGQLDRAMQTAVVYSLRKQDFKQSHWREGGFTRPTRQVDLAQEGQTQRAKQIVFADVVREAEVRRSRGHSIQRDSQKVIRNGLGEVLREMETVGNEVRDIVNKTPKTVLLPSPEDSQPLYETRDDLYLDDFDLGRADTPYEIMCAIWQVMHGILYCVNMLLSFFGVEAPVNALLLGAVLWKALGDLHVDMKPLLTYGWVW